MDELRTFGFIMAYQVDATLKQQLERTFRFEVPRSPKNPQKLTLSVPGHEQIDVIPSDGDGWHGIFDAGPEGITGCFGTPSPDVLCVVIRGQGYWVPVSAPAKFQLIRSMPIRSVLRIPERDVIVFVDYTTLTAYGENGVLWRTDELSWDGIELTKLTAESIEGTGWNAPREAPAPFWVQVATGISSGGSAPPMKHKADA